jgi:hypothetical protein
MSGLRGSGWLLSALSLSLAKCGLRVALSCQFDLGIAGMRTARDRIVGPSVRSDLAANQGARHAKQ